MSGGSQRVDYSAQESASKAEANKLRYEKDLKEWEQNRKVQAEKRGQASKDAFDRGVQRSLLSKAGDWARGLSKSYIGTEQAPELQNTSLLAQAATKKADGTVVEDDPYKLKKTVIKQ